MTFNDWLLSIGKSERTANSYSGAVNGVISDWVVENNISSKRLGEVRSYSVIQHIVQGLESVDIYQQRNKDGNSMYSAALKKYAEYLFEHSAEDIQEDINNVLEDPEISTTEKSTLISTRIGQGKFRNGLIDYWQGCAITGYKDTRLLVASHIKPWKVSKHNERLDPFNGLLLLPNLDKAFDLGYISFTDKGIIKTSEYIESPGALGIKENMRINVVSQHQDYLAYHREYVFEK
ncbi:MAG: HNH endonuclease [Gammaproteobacteria bacterium]|nr:HNH endonuclease [Gammaproteobacteria bacterium]